MPGIIAQYSYWMPEGMKKNIFWTLLNAKIQCIIILTVHLGLELCWLGYFGLSLYPCWQDASFPCKCQTLWRDALPVLLQCAHFSSQAASLSVLLVSAVLQKSLPSGFLSFPAFSPPSSGAKPVSFATCARLWNAGLSMAQTQEAFSVWSLFVHSHKRSFWSAPFLSAMSCPWCQPRPWERWVGSRG